MHTRRSLILLAVGAPLFAAGTVAAGIAVCTGSPAYAQLVLSIVGLALIAWGIDLQNPGKRR